MNNLSLIHYLNFILIKYLQNFMLFSVTSHQGVGQMALLTPVLSYLLSTNSNVTVDT